MASAKYMKKVDSGDAAPLEMDDANLSFVGKRSTRKEKCLIAAVVVILIVAIVFIALYAYRVSKSETAPKSTGKESSTSSPTNLPSICLSETCVSVAADMLTSMNRSADPCDDFFEYACGSWIANNFIPESKTSWSQFRVLYQRNEEVMRELIMNPETRKAYSGHDAIKKGFDMFDSCMDTDLINERGAAPLLDLIKLYGSWNVTDANWTEGSWNFMDTFVEIQKKLSIAPLFNMYVSVDYKDSTKNIIVLDQSGLGISPEAYFKNTSYHVKVRTAYKVLMVKLAKLLGGGPDSEALMMEIFEFEKEVAKTFIPREQRRDTNAIYKKMTLETFITQSEIKIDLMVFLKKMFEETGYNITKQEVVVSFALDYVKNMSLIYEKTEKRLIANYMMWHVVLRFASYLSDPFEEAFNDYHESVRGSAGKDPRWQDCLGVVDGSFGMPFGLLFVDKTFKGASKTSAEDMIHDIRQVFLENLKELDWMDDKTKTKARAKALEIRENIGYPLYLKNTTEMTRMFKGFNINVTQYFENIWHSYRFFNMKNYEKLGKPVNKDKWSMTPPTVNAYYSSTDNKIAFPAGILQRPFYDNRFPKALNYGGIGMVVGHEITHGFDDTGRLFNKDGNLAKWWTNASIASFKEKTQCLVDQYSNYTFHGKNLKGEQTLGENIADNGGIKQAFQAYQNWKKSPRGGEEPALPGMGDFTNDQVFFLGFAQIWCSKYRNTSAIRQIDYGVHSPGKFRVIGSLSNFDEFGKAYNCPIGSRMNPEKKCAVW